MGARGCDSPGRPDHRKVRRSRAVRAERCGKGEPSARQVGARKASESDPLMTCRKPIRRHPKPGAHRSPGISLGDTCLLPRRGPAYRWREPGSGVHAELENLSFRNCGRCGAWTPWSREGDPQAAETARGRVPVAEHRGGLARSSDEGPVMGLERRGWVTRTSPVVNRVGGMNCWCSSELDDQPCSGKVHLGSSRPAAVSAGWVARAG